MEKKKGSLMIPIVGSIILAVLITAMSIVLFTVFNSISSNASQTEAYEARLLSDIKAELKNETQEAMGICEFMYQKYKAGEISMEQAQKNAADIIRDLRYNDGDGYFWVDTSKGINVVLLGRDTEGNSRWDSVDPNGTYFIQEMIKNGMQDGGGYTKLMFAKPNETEPLPKINYTAYYEPFDWVMGTGVWVDYIDSLTATYKATASAALRNTIIQSVVVFVVLLGVGIAIAIYMGKRITSPIILATNQLKRMSENDFTDTEELEKLRGLKGRNNEIGQISCALDSMHSDIRELMHTISDTTSYVASASEELSSNASQSANASEMVAISCTSVAESCSGQIAAVSGASEQTMNFVNNMQDFKDAIGRTREMIDSANEAAAKGAEDMTSATNMMELIKDSVDNTAGVVETLGEQLKNIDSFVETISEIADQTNLLSLNASIEAARAGEMGKGFAVVASEISKLAEQSNAAASKITGLISEIMQSSNEAVEAMRAGASNVAEGADTVNDAGDTFNNIVEMVHSISEQASRMSIIVSRLAEGTDSIADNIQKIESMTGKVADETQNVSATSEQQSASTQEVAEASDKLAQSALELQTFVSKFKF